MSWKSTARRSELPSNWEEIRLPVLQDEDYKCRLCGAPATHVDHIRRGNDHSRDNLQPLCEKCHRKKTAREGKEARYGLAPRRGKRFEPHPGIREA